MGPLDPTPPLVSTEGYNAPINQNQALADMLRRRNAATKQAQMSAGNAQMWDNTIGRPQFTQTVDGGRDQPDQVVVNWGDILGKGVSNYMGAKERKKSLDSEEEVQSINNQFMESTLQNDPTASKLYGAAQAGLPGADKALAEHLSPKKQSLAVLTQFISGGGDPEMARQLAATFGVDPEVAFRAAEFQNKRSTMKEDDKFSKQVVLQGMRGQQQLEIQNSKPTKTGYTQAELNAMPIDQRIAAIRAAGGGRESAESKERGKLRVAAEQDLPKTDYALNNLKDVAKLASEATYYPGNLGLANSALDRSGKNAMLRQAISQLVLDATGGKLGGGVSNADVQFLKEAQTNLESGNRDTVVAQINKLIANLNQHRQIMAQQSGTSVPEVQIDGPQSKLDYTNAKNLRKPAPEADTFEEDWGAVGGQ